METTVLIGCPVCGRRYRYDTARFGTSGVRLRCRSCEAVMRVEIPVPLLGESAAPAPARSAEAEAGAREGIPVAVPVSSFQETDPVSREGSTSVQPSSSEESVSPPQASVSEVTEAGEQESPAAAPAEGQVETPEAESMPVPPWERGTSAEPEVSPTVQANRPEDSAASPEAFPSADPAADATRLPVAAPAEGPAARAGADSPPDVAVDESAAVQATRSSLEREAERCLDGMFESGEEVQETVALPVALVADRDETMRGLLSAVLHDSGFQVEEATDGIEARRLLAAHRPAVVFLNAFLPEILGVTLCAEIKGHPELAAATRVVIVGSLYRRDRFVRNTRDLYGADDFLDGSGSPEEIRGRALELCADLSGESRGEAESDVDERRELMRLARIVVGDIILYNPETAEEEIAAGRFFETFAQEIREGESLVSSRYPHVSGHQSLYHETLREAVLQHGAAAGIPAHTGS